MTNYEKIKQMSVEKLARLLLRNLQSDCGCAKCDAFYNCCVPCTGQSLTVACVESYVMWLESEVEEC